MEREPSTLVLDAGGVLIAEPIPELLDEMAAQGRADPATVRTYFDAELYEPLWSGALPKAEFWRRLLEVTGASGSAAHWEEFFVSRLVPLPAAEHAPRWRKDADLMVVLSNHLAEWLHPALSAAGVDGLFDAVYVSSETGHVKPATAAYLDLRKAGVGFSPRTLVIDDRAGNLDAARALGMDSLLAGPGDGWLGAVPVWLQG